MENCLCKAFWPIICITFFLSLRVVKTQECAFKYENGTALSSIVIVPISETTPVGSIILTLLNEANGDVICQDPIDGILSKYVSYPTGGTRLEFNMSNSIGNDWDDNKLDTIIFGFCALSCNSTNVLTIGIQIIPENNQKPNFNFPSANITLVESMPFELDFSYMLTPDKTQLTVYDNDFPVDPDGLVDFSVDSSDFEALSPLEIKFQDMKNSTRTMYAPRVAVSRQINAINSPISFNLIATDRGIPSQQVKFPITINVTPQDLRDPVFKNYYYTTAIANSDDTGLLEISPAKVRAFDGDEAINEPISYKLIDNGGLDVSLVSGNDGVDVQLNSAVGEQNKKMAFIVIEARQTINTDRASTIVLFVELPEAVETSTTTATSGSQETCPTFNPSTDCPTATNPTECICITDSTNQSGTASVTDCPTGTTNTDCSVCFESSSTSVPPSSVTTECPQVTTNCPIVTCPTTDCPIYSTDSTCPSCPALSTDTSTITCSDCPICTTPSMTCPTATSPPTGPSVQFERQQYFSEVVENTPVNTVVVRLSATSSNGISPTYSLTPSDSSRFFAVDSVTGVVTVNTPLQVKTINLEAVASIPSGEQDKTTIIVSVVKGYTNSDVQFASPLYNFPMKERALEVIGTVELRNANPEEYVLNLTSTDPSHMIDYFNVDSNGDVTCIRAFNRTFSGSSILLSISATTNNNLKANPISTVVQIDVLDVNEKPQFVSYSSPFKIGYPSRTYFDPSVPMPLITIQAYDPDVGDNALLTYTLTGEKSNSFDIDSLTGSLYTKGLSSLMSEDCTLGITVTDKPGLNDTLTIIVSALDDNAVQRVNANGTESLTDQTIEADLSDIFGYRVTVLQKQKTLPSTRDGNNFNYVISLYALEKDSFVDQQQFIEKANSLSDSQLAGLSWGLDTKSISSPANYEPVTLKQSKEDFMVATIVLGCLFGLTLVLVSLYFVYYRIYKKESNFHSSAFQGQDSPGLEKKNLYSNSSDGGLINESGYTNPSFSSTTRFNQSLEEEDTESSVARNPSSNKTVVYNSNNPSPKVERKEIEPYNPPTPQPQRSILKDSNPQNKVAVEEKKVEKESGVKFNPTPDVIKVAPTIILPEESTTDDLEVEVM